MCVWFAPELGSSFQVQAHRIFFSIDCFESLISINSFVIIAWEESKQIHLLPGLWLSPSPTIHPKSFLLQQRSAFTYPEAVSALDIATYGPCGLYTAISKSIRPCECSWGALRKWGAGRMFAQTQSGHSLSNAACSPFPWASHFSMWPGCPPRLNLRR